MASVQVNQIRQELDLENRKELRQHAQSHEDRGGNAYCATLGDPVRGSSSSEDFVILPFTFSFQPAYGRFTEASIRLTLAADAIPDTQIIDYYPHEVKQDEMEAQSVKYNLRGELGFELTPPMFPLRIKPGISVENTTEYTVYQCLVRQAHLPSFLSLS